MASTRNKLLSNLEYQAEPEAAPTSFGIVSKYMADAYKYLNAGGVGVDAPTAPTLTTADSALVGDIIRYYSGQVDTLRSSLEAKSASEAKLAQTKAEMAQAETLGRETTNLAKINAGDSGASASATEATVVQGGDAAEVQKRRSRGALSGLSGTLGLNL